MKETTFKFGVELDSADAYETVRTKLAAIQGIESIELEEETLSLRVSFEDGEQAKMIHKKVMIALANARGVTVTSATTRLTDIF